MSDVRLEGLSKSYGGDAMVVKNIDLSVEHGALLTMVGPSGCGKTTTLKMISGFESITEGDIFIANERVNGVPAHRRDVTTVFQNYALFPHMTVFNNVAFGLVRRGTPRSEIRTRVGEMLDLVGLDAYADRHPDALSGGQQQRVALARSLVLRPKVILLDEPLSNLDAKLRKRMEVEVRNILQQNNVTAIHVTHDQEEALTMSDVVAVMNEGNIEQVGPPETIYRHPANRWVAEFIGTSNLLPLQDITAGRDGTATGRVAEAVPVRSAAPEGSLPDSAWLMFRPEAVRVCPEPCEEEVSDRANRLRGRVLSKLYLGRCTRLDVEIGGIESAITVDVVEEQSRFAVGAPITLEWDATDSWILTR